MPVSVRAGAREFKVGPVFLGSQEVERENARGPWAIIAISPDPLAPHRYLSRLYKTGKEALEAYRFGFDVMDPAREPRLTASSIVEELLKSPNVSAA